MTFIFMFLIINFPQEFHKNKKNRISLMPCLIFFQPWHLPRLPPLRSAPAVESLELVKVFIAIEQKYVKIFLILEQSHYFVYTVDACYLERKDRDSSR